MTFQKGNKLWKKSVAARRENKKRMQAFLEVIADGGIDTYMGLMERLVAKAEDGSEPLTESEKEFMDRFESWREFVIPKLSRKDVKHDGEVEVEVTHVYIPRKNG